MGNGLSAVYPSSPSDNLWVQPSAVNSIVFEYVKFFKEVPARRSHIASTQKKTRVESAAGIRDPGKMSLMFSPMGPFLPSYWLILPPQPRRFLLPATALKKEAAAYAA